MPSPLARYARLAPLASVWLASCTESREGDGAKQATPKSPAGATTSPAPTPVASQAPSPTPVPAPTPSPEPSAAPTAEPSPAPTAEPSPAPTAEPSPAPTAQPTPAPTPSPSPTGTAAPTPVAMPLACGAVPHGGNETRIRYFISVAPLGTACSPETQARACTHGAFSAWSGAATSPTCTDISKGALSNDSVGGQARFEWSVPSATEVRLAVTTSRAAADAWLGEESISAGHTFATHAGCTGNGLGDGGATPTLASPAYNPARAGSTVALEPAGLCGIDLSALAPWERRYVRLFARLPDGRATRSDVRVAARVPDGMVFVAAEDWPDEGHAADVRFDFALDKFATTDEGGSIDSSGEYPSNSSTIVLGSARRKEPVFIDWSSAKKGCENRNATVPAGFLGAGVPDRMHLVTDMEWFLGAYGTPGSMSGACFAKDPLTGLDDPLTGAPSRKGCLSRYGAWEMANTFENVDAIIDAQAPAGGLIALTKRTFAGTVAETPTSHSIPAGTDDSGLWGDFIAAFNPGAVLPTAYGASGSPAFDDGVFRVKTGDPRVLIFRARYEAFGENELTDPGMAGFSAYARCALRKP